MSATTITGKDTLILDGRIFNDFANADVSTIEFPNDLMNGTTGKNGNTIIASNATGQNVDMTLRLLRGSADDKWLNSRLLEYVNDPAAFITLNGEFIKRAGDGAGNVSADSYILKNGVIQKIPGTKENVEGDVEQSVVVYNLKFFSGTRSIG
jgi:hypothetical protein